MKQKAQSVYLKLLAFCMALLGFAACGDEPLEYGSPTAAYKISGKVVSSEDKEPIEGIEVVLCDDDIFGYMESSNITTYTDKDGFFLIETVLPTFGDDVVVNFNDIDGAENGEFKDGFLTVEFESSDFKGGDNWYQGKAERDMGTVKMIPIATSPKEQDNK